MIHTGLRNDHSHTLRIRQFLQNLPTVAAGNLRN